MEALLASRPRSWGTHPLGGNEKAGAQTCVQAPFRETQKTWSRLQRNGRDVCVPASPVWGGLQPGHKMREITNLTLKQLLSKCADGTFSGKDRKRAILLAPSALNPGVIAVVSTYVAVNNRSFVYYRLVNLMDTSLIGFHS